MHFYKTPGFFKWLFPELTWDVKESSKSIYLTFDDGPVPGVTEWVLEILQDFKAKATFFVVGDNIRKHRDLYERLINEGHKVGNHTYNHINAWTCNSREYLHDIYRCDEEMNLDQGTRLFRPPHGKLKPGLISRISKDYRIIMWDVLTGDFNKDLPNEKSLRESISNTKEGSIIVFHDSYKAEKKLKWILPRYMEEMKSKGFSFHSLEG